MWPDGLLQSRQRPALEGCSSRILNCTSLITSRKRGFQPPDPRAERHCLQILRPRRKGRSRQCWGQPPEGPAAHPTAPGITTSCRWGPRGQSRRPPGQPGQMSPTSLTDGCRTLGEKDGTKPSWVSREAGISPPPQTSSRAPVSCCPQVIDPPHSPSEVEAE